MRSGQSGAVRAYRLTFSSRKWREGFFMPISWRDSPGVRRVKPSAELQRFKLTV